MNATAPPRRALLVASLVALPLLLLWQLLLTNRILVGLDVFNFFYPSHDFAAAALRSGRLPLWNPHLFLGVPFLADSQTQMLYPPAWPLLLLSAPRALAVALALHMVIAAMGTLLWARRALRLTAAGSWVVAIVFVLGGYLGSQAEHPNQLAAAAWLPWLLLGADLARRRPLRGIVLGSAALALSLLAGHAQTTFISLTALLLDWALALLLAWGQRPRPDPRPLLAGPLALLLLGGALAAAQLVPQAELSRLSIRAAGLTLREAVSFSWDPRLWPRALLPTFGADVRLLSEYVAYVGFSGALLALLGLWRGVRGRAWWLALACLAVGLFLAPAAANPLYGFLWRTVPGFALFRAPARWLLLVALGAALLAGLGAERLLRSDRRPPADEGARTWGGCVACVLTVGVPLLALASLPFADLPARGVWRWWLAAGMASAASLWALPRLRPGWRLPLLAVLLAGELLLASRQLDLNKATAPEAYAALRPAPAHLLAQRPPAGQPRLLSLSGLTWDPGDLVELSARHADLLGPEAAYDLVVATKLKEVLAPNQPLRWGLNSADGYGGGLLPLASYTELQRLLPLARLVPDGRLREQLTRVPDRRLLDLLGVAWIVADKVDDLWLDGLFHQLTVPATVAPGAPLSWPLPPRTSATAVSLVARGPIPTDLRAILTVAGEGGAIALPLVAADFQPVREGRHGAELRALLPLPAPASVATLRLAAQSAQPWTLAGLTVVDARLPAFEPLVADPTFETTLSGDVVVLRRRDALGRAWAVPEATVVFATEVTPTLTAPDFDPRQRVVLVGEVEAPPWLPPGPQLTSAQVRWLAETPEWINLAVSSDGAGWLVLADNWFPGWQATVNGAPVAIERANGFARAVALPSAGSHRVTFAYRPRSVLLGGAVSGGALALWAGLVAVGWRRARRLRRSGASHQHGIIARRGSVPARR